MSKKYQTRARSGEPDPPEITIPEQVTVSLAEIAESAREGLLALSAGVGMQVMHQIMEEDVAALCGPRGRHNPGRAGYRHSGEAGSVTLGGRRIPVQRPRVRAADGSGELHLPSYELFSSTEILSAMALERMLAGLSARRYRAGLEPVGTGIEARAGSASKTGGLPPVRRRDRDRARGADEPPPR